MIDEIKDALRAATPGPWAIGPTIAFKLPTNRISAGGASICQGAEGDNAHLIANAPTWLAALVARVEELEREKSHRIIGATLHDCDDECRNPCPMDLGRKLIAAENRITELEARAEELEAKLGEANDQLAELQAHCRDQLTTCTQERDAEIKRARVAEQWQREALPILDEALRYANLSGVPYIVTLIAQAQGSRSTSMVAAIHELGVKAMEQLDDLIAQAQGQGE